MKWWVWLIVAVLVVVVVWRMAPNTVASQSQWLTSRAGLLSGGDVARTYAGNPP